MPEVNAHQFGPADQLRDALDSPTGQLPLFVQAKDLMAAVRPNPGDRLRHVETGEEEPDDVFWDRKLAETDVRGYREHLTGLIGSEPPRITTGTGTVKDGHHRLVAAATDRPDTWVAPQWEQNERGPVGHLSPEPPGGRRPVVRRDLSSSDRRRLDRLQSDLRNGRPLHWGAEPGSS